MSSNQTIDGKPLCVGMSGFTHYSTERADAPNYPPAVLSPTDILDMIRELTDLCTDPKFTTAVLLLKQHITDTNNPHHTTLDQFTQDIAEVLYQEFQKRTGSPLTLEEFVKALFEVIHIATDEEINEGICTTAVLSVFGAKKYLMEHDKDPFAHQELFNKIIPGTPIVNDPSFAWYPQFGLSEYFLHPQKVSISEAEELVAYSYTGADGFIYMEEKDKLPIDYIYKTPLVPCFDTRRNFIVDSTTCSTFQQHEVQLLEEAEESPDKTISATAVCQNDATGRYEHSLIYKNCILPPEQARTFSFYVKAEEQKYVKISFQDSDTVDLETYAIYDLNRNSCVIMNHLEMYNAEIQKLSNGWYRCCFSMYNPTGCIADLKITFFDYNENGPQDFLVDAKGKICAYVWGFQYENGFQPSPYIPTAGKIGVRPGIQIIIPMNDWYSEVAHTYHIDYKNPLRDPSKKYRPVLVIMDNEKNSVHIAHSGDHVQIKRFYTYTEIDKEYEIPTLHDEMTTPAAFMLQITHGLSSKNSISRVNSFLSFKNHSELLHNEGTNMYIGTMPDGSFLNGYVSNCIFYPICVTEDEAQFLNGDTYE